jgi:hypothetical protein
LFLTASSLVHCIDNEEWKKFVETTLKEKEDLEKEPLGGEKPQRPEGFFLVSLCSSFNVFIENQLFVLTTVPLKIYWW